MERGRTTDIRPGDMIGFAGCGCWSCVVQVCTLGWPGKSLSHVEVAVGWPGHRWPLLVGATAGIRDEPCAVTGRILDGVQAHYARTRIARYEGRVYHYRLARPLNDLEQRLLYDFCRENMGRAYDGLGAVLARDTLWAAMHRPAEDLVSMFCSEFVAAAHRACWRLPPETNASEWSPNRLARMEVREGVVGKPRRLK